MRITGNPDVLFAPATPGAFGGLGITAGDLPGDWASYTAEQKIAYFNENAISADELKAAGVPQSDLDWMAQHGYTGQPETASTVEDVQQVAQAVTLPAAVPAASTLTQTATQSVVTATQPAAVPTTATSNTTQTAITQAQLPAAVQSFELPADWSAYTTAQKIHWFNQNSITAQQLSDAGVSVADIAYMSAHGYTGKPAAMLTITKGTANTTAAAGGVIPLVLAVAAAYFFGA